MVISRPSRKIAEIVIKQRSEDFWGNDMNQNTNNRIIIITYVNLYHYNNLIRRYIIA